MALLPVAVWILASGLDDLFVLIVYLWDRRRASSEPVPELATESPEKRIAIFVPCWREAAVITDMVEHNLSAIRYGSYDIFIGGYPNDEGTLNSARELEARHERVHLCLCPHDGPTSKADCLNWIYQQMLFREEEQKNRFELVITHDAEDVIHPDELRWMNLYAERYDMVQTPVLPFHTPWHAWTHGLYCDDFSEGHTKDLAARQALGGFIPSCGVGTGYTRRAIEALASESNRVFEPACLTEDYENGLRIHSRGMRQIFVPLTLVDGTPMATREYFPRRFWDAVRQRTRWVTGISLQSWERHGWSSDPRQAYWMWRDRKGLLGNPIGLAANLLTLYGLLRLGAGGSGEFLAQALSAPGIAHLLAANLIILLINMAVRAACTAEIYGVAFALGVPFRAVFGNALNTVATCRAVHLFLRAKLSGQPLGWVKTEHAYPSRVGLLPHKRPIEEILTGSGYATPEQLMDARPTKPPGEEIILHLIRRGVITEEEAYEALSLQLGMTLGEIDPEQVQESVARSLPERIVQEWQALPVKIESGSLHVVCPAVPREKMQDALREFTSLEVRVQLVTPSNFRRLAETLL